MASQYVENPVQVNVGSLDLAVSHSISLFSCDFWAFTCLVTFTKNGHRKLILFIFQACHTVTQIVEIMDGEAKKERVQ